MTQGATIVAACSICFCSTMSRRRSNDCWQRGVSTMGLSSTSGAVASTARKQSSSSTATTAAATASMMAGSATCFHLAKSRLTKSWHGSAWFSRQARQSETGSERSQIP